jgi:hypothetical protein
MGAEAAGTAAEAGMPVVLIGTALAGMAAVVIGVAAAGIMVVTVAVGELDPR